jgi:uncharacterized protein YegJ (DUF2314 family)
MSESRITMVDDDDPAMQAAYENARAGFRYFWRELSWERRRIVPGLDLAAVKAPFSDDRPATKGEPNVEQMWIGDVDFDGRTVQGSLLNSPNWLRSVQAGDPVSVPLRHITDWMYAIAGEVYGAFTVQVIRSRMNPRERQEHDEAWGLSFGDPRTVRVVPEGPNWFKAGGADGEHPMSEAMGPSLKDQLKKSPAMVRSRDERGWTFLHQLALAGSAAVRLLLEAGADPNARAHDGTTPLQLARSLAWQRIIDVLVEHGAKA